MAKKAAAAKPPETTTEKQPDRKVLYKSTCLFTSGSWNKNGGKLGCKIAAKLCPARIREEYLVNATLTVLISSNPELDDVPSLPGFQDAYPSKEMAVKVNQHSTSTSDVSFSMAFDRNDMPADFLKAISQAAGSLYVLGVRHGENDALDEDYEDDDLED